VEFVVKKKRVAKSKSGKKLFSSTYSHDAPMMQLIYLVSK